jgi:hypothetical protein
MASRLAKRADGANPVGATASVEAEDGAADVTETVRGAPRQRHNIRMAVAARWQAATATMLRPQRSRKAPRLAKEPQEPMEADAGAVVADAAAGAEVTAL